VEQRVALAQPRLERAEGVAVGDQVELVQGDELGPLEEARVVAAELAAYIFVLG
jgi:hypothetical protein